MPEIMRIVDLRDKISFWIKAFVCKSHALHFAKCEVFKDTTLISDKIPNALYMGKFVGFDNALFAFVGKYQNLMI